MAKGSTELTGQAFNRLLEWLGQDRDLAARRYEHIRSRLIRIFICRGCTVPEELADETIDRVAGKVQQIAGAYVGDPALYFYGVAEKIYLEHTKNRSVLWLPLSNGSSGEIELKHECLEGCMERLSQPSRDLIIAYYGNDGRSKIESRKDLAQCLGLRANALWIRAHRIRESLRKCVSECFNRAQSSPDSNYRKEPDERHATQ